MAEQQTETDIELAASIVVAYVGHNSLKASELPLLLQNVHKAIAGLTVSPEPEEPELRPVVSIRKSITPDYLICLDDGKKLKSLKRHLSILGMTPAEYRTKWSLPSDYPMVAPNYSATRSALAKSIGLGRRAAATPPPAPEPKKPVARKPRKKAATV